MSDAKQDFIDEVMRLAGEMGDAHPGYYIEAQVALRAFLQERIGEPVVFSDKQTVQLYRLDGVKC